jgi:uncharacterized protein (DUF1499 family)
MIWLALLIGVLLLLVVPPVLIIDDWSRDLTTNHAATSEQAADEALRPIHAGRGAAEMVELVKGAAGNLPRWDLAEETAQGDEIKLHYVRTTPLFRFQDDITVTIAPEGEGSVVTAESQSRVGKGDLGQNPRNLKELLGTVRREVKGKR